VNDDECALAMEALNSAYPYVPMADVQRRQFQRLFAGYSTEVVRDVLTDLIDVGIRHRPGPAEFGELLQTKSGRVAPGGRVQRPGPFLEEQPPPADFTDRMAELRGMVG